jgi:hypothetical protein
VGKAMEGNNKKADYPDCQAEGWSDAVVTKRTVRYALDISPMECYLVRNIASFLYPWPFLLG